MMEEIGNANVEWYNHKKHVYHYAYLLDESRMLPAIHLVELSVYSRINRMALLYYMTSHFKKTKVAYVPKSFVFICRLRKRIKKEYWEAIDEAMMGLLLEKSNSIVEHNYIQRTVICAVINKMIKQYFRYESRRNTLKKKEMKEKMEKLYDKRFAEEQHLNLSLIEDLHRSIHELNHIAKNMK